MVSSMSEANHYQSLEISQDATLAQIKQAYRRIAKQYHPDVNPNVGDRDRIIHINAAYEVLSDPQKRRSYDASLYSNQPQIRPNSGRKSYPNSGQDIDELFHQWLAEVYLPVNRLLAKILNSLQEQLDELAADPFDDELLEDFQAYLEDCREFLSRAQILFNSMPNPPNVARIAANLYYCLNQVGDGIEEFQWFTLNYDDYYLHTGQELFRIASKLRREAQFDMKQVSPH